MSISVGVEVLSLHADECWKVQIRKGTRQQVTRERKSDHVGLVDGAGNSEPTARIREGTPRADTGNRVSPKDSIGGAEEQEERVRLFLGD